MYSMANPIIDQISIRGWKDSDLGASVVLNREAEEHINMTSETGDWAGDMMGITETFIGSGGQFVLGHIEEQLVVMGGFKVVSESLAEIKRMRVTPLLQGKGIGSWFIRSLEERVLETGIDDVILSTTSEQVGALKLYNRAGYKETGRVEVDRGHEKGLIVVSFAKNIRS